MIQNLDVFLWNRKVGTLVSYKDKYTEKVCVYYDRSEERRAGEEC